MEEASRSYSFDVGRFTVKVWPSVFQYVTRQDIWFARVTDGDRFVAEMHCTGEDAVRERAQRHAQRLMWEQA